MLLCKVSHDLSGKGLIVIPSLCDGQCDRDPAEILPRTSIKDEKRAGTSESAVDSKSTEPQEYSRRKKDGYEGGRDAQVGIRVGGR